MIIMLAFLIGCDITVIVY